jgi:cytidylate kinase
MPYRAERIVRLYGDSEKSPEARLQEKDKRRKVNYQHYTGRTWGAAENYDICINTGTITEEQAADIIISLVSD